MSLDIQKTLVISTAHVPKAVATLLNNPEARSHINGYMTDWSIYGWVFWADCEPDDSVPPELAAVYQFAKGHGCAYVRMDCDADKVEDLPSWEW